MDLQKAKSVIGNPADPDYRRYHEGDQILKQAVDNAFQIAFGTYPIELEKLTN